MQKNESLIYPPQKSIRHDIKMIQISNPFSALDEMSMLSKTPTGMIKTLHAKRSSAEPIPCVSQNRPYELDKLNT